MKDLKKVSFKNKKQPTSHFDIINLQDVLKTRHDHSPTDFHIVEFFIIIFIEAGRGYHTVDFTDYTLSKGTLLTVRKDQIQKFHETKNLKGKLLLFTNEFIARYFEELEAQKTMLLFNELLGTPNFQLDNPAFENISQLISRIGNEYLNINDNHSMGIIRSELHVLISNLFRLKTKKKLINTEKKYLKEFIALQEIVEKKVFETTKVKDFARKLGLSTKTLNTITKTIIHKTAKEFVDEICTKQIKRLLTNTDLSIKEVAYQAGFEETTNFYKYFKRQTKITPEQYRVTNM